MQLKALVGETPPEMATHGGVQHRAAILSSYADPMREEFRDFLQRHAALLERLPAWTLRIVVPPHLAEAPDQLQKMAWGHLASPLSELVLTEARWYFDRRAGGLEGLSDTADRRRFGRCERAFATDRYTVLYRCWREDGERVLTIASSPVVGMALESGAAKIEPLVTAVRLERQGRPQVPFGWLLRSAASGPGGPLATLYEQGNGSRRRGNE
jgi:hypothetical protein